ncbi:MAG TPA: 30S ribosomal protein S21 [Anaerolineae bacterium]|nr:30S ribosomal protein S21 [Anaerolineae bacterium]
MSALAKVVAKPNESPEQLIRRFKKEVMKSKVLADSRRKRWFISKSELRRIKEKKAARRVRKQRGR